MLVLALICPATLAETIRVRLRKTYGKIELAGFGVNVGLQQQMIVLAGMPQMGRLEVRLQTRRGRWPVWHVRREGEKKSTHLAGEKLFIEGQTLQVGLRPVPNTLELVAAENGRVDVIAALDLEKYLTGVLPSEMPAHWPMEALKAQAVASRSYALALMQQRRDQAYHLESTVFDQVFDLQNHTGASEEVRKKVALAVRETAGQVLLDERGRVVKAHYHADCGGRTETARNVWGESVQETGVVKDALCPLSPLAQWQHHLTKQELREALAPHFGIGPGVSLLSVAMAGRTPSGRVVSVDVVFSDRQPRRLSSHDFRRLLGFSSLKSTNFSFLWQGEKLVVEGRGHGHGVGMCQYGARQLATRGLNYRQIVATYYPNVKIGSSGTSRPVL